MQFKHKKFIAELFAEVSVMWLIFTLIELAWCGLEILFDGGVQPSFSDTIIGIVLCYSLFRNLHWTFEHRKVTRYCDTD